MLTNIIWIPCKLVPYFVVLRPKNTLAAILPRLNCRSLVWVVTVWHLRTDHVIHFFGQRAKEDVLQKEVRVKILKDNIKMLATKVPSSGQDLATELNVVLENYQLLCNRIRGKCHTLEVRMIALSLVKQRQVAEEEWRRTLKTSNFVTESNSFGINTFCWFLSLEMTSLESMRHHLLLLL